MAEKSHACDDCGLLFNTAHDVQTWVVPRNYTVQEKENRGRHGRRRWAYIR